MATEKQIKAGHDAWRRGDGIAGIIDAAVAETEAPCSVQGFTAEQIRTMRDGAANYAPENAMTFEMLCDAALQAGALLREWQAATGSVSPKSAEARERVLRERIEAAEQAYRDSNNAHVMTLHKLDAVQAWAERGTRPDHPAEVGHTHPVHRSACKDVLAILENAVEVRT